MSPAKAKTIEELRADYEHFRREVERYVKLPKSPARDAILWEMRRQRDRAKNRIQSCIARNKKPPAETGG